MASRLAGENASSLPKPPAPTVWASVSPGTRQPPTRTGRSLPAERCVRCTIRGSSPMTRLLSKDDVLALLDPDAVIEAVSGA
ncbi:MAG: hypothetical protein NTV35_06730, partial [Chloroflexi bacterium]|nr:hypothetical protein [Chloroflexota bacterium]